MRIPLIYIAGPFHASTHWGVHCNVADAEELALTVAHNGGFPVCPHKNTENFDGLLTEGFWLAGTLALMHRCDAVVTVDTWEQSEGARREVAIANAGSMPVFHGVFDNASELRAWIEDFSHRGEIE